MANRPGLSAWLSEADSILRGEPGPSGGDRTWRRLAGSILACGLFYGAVMGSFGGISGGRALMVAYSAVKVPLLLLATLLLSLPSFFVFHTLLGVRADFAEAVRGVLGSQAGLTIILASLAPITATWYASSSDYRTAILFNATMFGLASLAAQVVLRRAYRPLIARNPVHRLLLIAWIIVYAFVGIQMGWVLRPFIGNPAQPVQFLRPDGWDNAYVVVARMIWEVVAR